MKKLPVIFIAALTGIALTSCKPKASASSDSDDTPATTQTTGDTEGKTAGLSGIQTVSLKVTGMKWGNVCVKKVQVALDKVDGVKGHMVSMPDKAEVTGTANTADMIAAIEKAGFKAEVR